MRFRKNKRIAKLSKRFWYCCSGIKIFETSYSVINCIITVPDCGLPIDNVLLILNVTSQEFAHCGKVCKSALRIMAASSGRSAIMYKLVSSANKRIVTNSFDNVVKNKIIKKQSGKDVSLCGSS